VDIKQAEAQDDDVACSVFSPSINSDFTEHVGNISAVCDKDESSWQLGSGLITGRGTLSKTSTSTTCNVQQMTSNM